jgi:hypothetical protein
VRLEQAVTDAASGPGRAPVRFRIVPGQSRLKVTAKSNVHPIHGESDQMEGFIDLALKDGIPDLTAPAAARLEIQVDRIKADNSLFENELHRRLDIRRFPRIVGELIGAIPTADGEYTAEGNLTFHGTTRPLETPMRVRVLGGTRLEAQWDQKIDIREFNLTAPRILAFKVDPVVEVSLKVVAEKEGEST